MLAIDANVLVYAHRRETAEHDVAKRTILELAEGARAWAIPWPCVYEFYSVVTNPRIWQRSASTPHQAWQQLAAWFGSPSLSLIGETDGFAAVLQDFVLRPRVRGAVVHDARVAAICAAHGVDELLTRDRDFTAFPELRTRNPFG